MRKNNTAIIFGSLFFSCSVMAANGTLAPTVVPMVNGGQASIAISNTSPNLFTVPGDRIIAVNSLDGALTNNEQTASGGVVVAQFAYYLAGFPWYEGNILFAFAVAAQVLTWCETRTWWRSAETMLLLAMWLPFSGTSYGIAGLLMLAVSHRLYRAEDRMERLALVACLLAVIPALNLATSDAAAVAGLVMTVLTVGLVSCTGKSLPRFWYGDFFPTFYACHLTVLGVLAV
ncbi:type-F conjugative transfer system pilin acetylase TraX [Escherichia coli]|uniref:type-F conjugative transfer system pilin acetylase TraX n=1 Tax=Escherichia coli TaxID=562 RepID=UPI0017C5031A|nr:type-F conjugative transfer system pilin acetylase TraX [Escherichia coli]HAH1595386.1 type-F conjugative transfer system pilin acetylase TraX [Escherichia coli]HAM4060159.1 type-F conjugative transfer system pilin acetylase TraX [Escherichia coli]HAM4079077.1 type-F conjugative transfer system pilin acetylase TraX [Escherichia coli]